MSEKELASLTEAVSLIAKQTGVFLLGELGKVSATQIEEKSLNSLVSYVDKSAEEKIVAGLKKLLPNAGFLTEEETVEQTNATCRWIIDPLDGTTNFLFGLPCFAVSIALECEGVLQLGVIYEPNREECFYAWKGGGAWCNGETIRCRENRELKNSLLATGFPYYDYSRTEQYMKLFTFLIQNCRGIRRWGSAAIDLAYVACGRYDGFFEYSLNSWDIAAGLIIIEEAGGIVTDFEGKNGSLQSGEVVAGGKAFQPNLLQKVKGFM